ncbi:MAG: aquaporin, partial [Bdellovibrionaceae bacterium]|nr:aquaporin [Pseudobdellovibrionaceae bacterium]
MNRLLFNKCVAELLGAFAIVFFGCGYVAISANPSPEFTSVIFGTTVSLMIYSVGHVSGAHFNPAVTLGFASIGWFSWKEVPFYIVFQIIGAIFAAALLSWFIPNATTLAPTTPSISTSRAFFIEAILSFFLMFVITSMSTDPRAPKTIAGIAIGSTVAVDAFLGGPLTGAS